MTRTLIGWLLLGIVAASCGCVMCASPFDYCGPTYDDGVDSCCPRARAGSILAGTAEPAAVVGPEPYQGPAYIDAAPDQPEPMPDAFPQSPVSQPQTSTRPRAGMRTQMAMRSQPSMRPQMTTRPQQVSARSQAAARPQQMRARPQATARPQTSLRPQSNVRPTPAPARSAVSAIGPNGPYLTKEEQAAGGVVLSVTDRSLAEVQAEQAQTAAAKAAASDAATASTTPAAPVTLTDAAPAIAIASGETSVKLAENTPRRASGWSPRR